MRYQALATDYDGTLASHGTVADSTLGILKRVLGSGRKLVLVTGRHLPDLKNVFPAVGLFHRVVAENGALLYRPSSGDERLLGEPPAPELLSALRQRNVPFSVGRGIVATTEPHQVAVQSAIDELHLDLDVILNKGSVMMVRRGVNKATGLKAALDELRIHPQNVIGIGDAENDDSLLSACGFGVAVANALPFLKQMADFVTESRNGAGVAELCEHLMADDLASLEARLSDSPRGSSPEATT